MRSFELNTIPQNDLAISNDGDDKLLAVDEYKISQTCRKKLDKSVRDDERSAFASIDSSVAWIETAIPQICLFYGSHLQQCAPSLTAHHIAEKVYVLQKF